MNWLRTSLFAMIRDNCPSTAAILTIALIRMWRRQTHDLGHTRFGFDD